MSKAYSGTKHIYTLNDSKLSQEEDSENDSLDQDQTDYEEIDIQKENKKLLKSNEQLHRIISQLQLKGQQLLQINRLTQKRNAKHEQKQRELIKRLSYLQVSNKQQTCEIKRLEKELLDIKEVREERKVSEGQTVEVKQLMKRSLAEKEKFVLLLKNLLEMLGRCEKQQEYQLQRDKIMQFVSKNIGTSDSSKLACEFDLKFELSRVDTLKEKIRSLEREVEESQGLLEKERGERRKVVGMYNEKIGKLREMYQGLKEKVQLQQEQNRRKIKSIVNEKNEVIEGLRSKLKESHIRKSSMQVKKSRESKKCFIGDGDYSHLQLNQLNQAIENLEMQIIKEFQE